MLSTSLAFALSALGQAAAVDRNQALLHPPETIVYLELPDLLALRSAYADAPLARFLLDPQVEGFFAGVVHEDPETFRIDELLLRRLEGGLAQLDPSVARCIELFGAAKRLSLSITGTPPAPKEEAQASEQGEISVEAGLAGVGALLALTLPSAEAARETDEALASLLAMDAPGTEAAPSAEGGARVLALTVFGADMTIWTLVRDEQLFVGWGRVRPEELAARLAGEAPALGGDARFQDGRARVAAGAGTTIYEAFFRVEGVARALASGDVPLPREALASLSALVTRILPGDSYESHRRTRLVEGRFVQECFRRESPDARSLFGALGHAPVPEEALLPIPPDAVAGWATSLDSAQLARQIGELVEESTGKPLEESLASVRERFGFDPLADLVAAAGERVSFYCLPISGLTLPKVHLVVELRDPQAFERGLQGMGRFLVWASGGEVELGARPYRNVPLYSFAPRRDLGQLAGQYGASSQIVTLVPSIVETELAVTIFENRAIFGIGKTGVKREIKRLLAGAAPQLHPVFAAEGAFPPEATSVAFADWGSMFKGIYDAFRAFVPVIAQAADGLPFDPNELPESTVFTRYFAPTRSWTRAVEGGHLSSSNSAFGPEVPFALALGVGIGASFGSELESRSIPAPVEVEVRELEDVPPPPEALPVGEGDPVARTREILRDVKLALVVYKTDRGRFPAELDLLFQPTERFPNGFLEGSAPILDAWGRAIAYEALEAGAAFRSWSLGADGADQRGSGDDLRID